MMILVTGGSGSGKSEYAEGLYRDFSMEHKKYYLATMEVYGEEGRKRVQKHRDMRRGKGFETIEQPKNIKDSLLKMTKNSKAVLLECMSNLVANEMFGKEQRSADETVKKVVSELEDLEKEVEEFVIVTNNVFEDGIKYDEGTMEYIRALAKVNRILTKKADQVIEVVVGIPLVLKGEEK